MGKRLLDPFDLPGGQIALHRSRICGRKDLKRIDLELFSVGGMGSPESAQTQQFPLSDFRQGTNCGKYTVLSCLLPVRVRQAEDSVSIFLIAVCDMFYVTLNRIHS